MSEPKDLPTLTREELLALVVERQRPIAELRTSHEALRAELDQLTRGGRRQAAPFSRDTRVTDPKPPGRKPGCSTFRDREAPPPETVTAPPVEVPVRQVPAVLQVLTGVQVTQGALTPDALRQAQNTVGTVYAQLRAAVPGAPVVHTDDTGWRVGGEAAYLMAFETDPATVYQSRPRHRHEEVQEVIPADDEGVMVTDRGRRDARAFDHVAPHKCLSHLLRSLSDVVEAMRGRAHDFGARLKGLLQDALALWQAHRDGDALQFKAEALHAALTYHLRHRHRQDPDHQRLLNELGWPHDRGNLVRFLADPWIEPTNRWAERALRPAVIARTVSQCSKSGRGADAFAAFTSVMRTRMNAGAGSVVDELSTLFRRPQPQHVPT